MLKLSRETIVRLHKMDYALVSSLQRDPLLAKRVKHLQTIPGVGPITALNGLEIGEVERFHSLKQAISYCGLCGEESSSAETVKRTPISKKQRNKHIQSVLVEAAKLALGDSPETGARLRKGETKRQCESCDPGGRAQARGLPVGSGPPPAGLRAAREQKRRSLNRCCKKNGITRRADCQVLLVPDWAKERNLR